eukprot:CAMPEP_0195287748 /NCGR_PEP_ID=MMETSP0707-20130614/4681_1 /TAXON_ID=33640 /ORGANISM="Asterionellopsis glacialis, Strain CCMP134" /LENGTH=308 /DNA_ID=CAMNT_0040347531 /DNA_START=141 /DNA_END=1067 /DNA_ORIENTATION=+
MFSEEDTSDSLDEEVSNFPSTTTSTTTPTTTTDSPPVTSSTMSAAVPVDPWMTRTDNSPVVVQQQQQHDDDVVVDNNNNNNNNNIRMTTATTTTPKPAITTTQTEEEETQQALRKLKLSSKKLTSALHHISSDIDGRIGLTKGVVDTLGNSVRHMNESHQVSTKVSNTWEGATSTMTGWFTRVDQRLALSHKTKRLSSSLHQNVLQPLSTTTKETLGPSSRAIQEFDQTHGITRTTVTTLATGVDFLADSANAMTGRGRGDHDDNDIDNDIDNDELRMEDETQELDEDGLPSSFQSDDTPTSPDVVDV